MYVCLVCLSMHLLARPVGVYVGCMYSGDTPCWTQRKGQRTNIKPTKLGHHRTRQAALGRTKFEAKGGAMHTVCVCTGQPSYHGVTCRQRRTNTQMERPRLRTRTLFLSTVLSSLIISCSLLSTTYYPVLLLMSDSLSVKRSLVQLVGYIFFDSTHCCFSFSFCS